jgi:hypothetical protein
VGLVSGPSFRMTTRSSYLCLLSCFEGNVQGHNTEPNSVGFGGFQIQHELTPEGFELYGMPMITSVWIICFVCFMNYSSINASWKSVPCAFSWEITINFHLGTVLSAIDPCCL